MKKLATLLLLLALPYSHILAAVYDDVGPDGRQNVLPVEGGGCAVTIDVVTPLPELIGRLHGNWREVETGKGYWIGYTQDMYSIAAHGDPAIGPLMDLVRQTKSDRAKFGAILTLHLIGIDRKVIGRTTEDFQNQRARDALLSLLADQNLQVRLLKLLIRDPWPSDVPSLFSVLKSGTPHAWAFVKALQRYKIEGRPVHQQLPRGIARLPCECTYKTAEESYLKPVEALSKAVGDKLVVEPGLLDGDLWSEGPRSEGYYGGGFGYVLRYFRLMARRCG